MDSHFIPTEPAKDTTLTPKRHVERSVFSKAIYMVTNIFDIDEPLRLALRKEAISLLTCREDVYAVHKIKDMLTLASSIGILSPVNTKILLEALDSIQDTQSVQKEVVEIQSVFDSEQVHVSTIEISKKDNTAVSIKEERVTTEDSAEHRDVHPSKEEGVQDADSDHVKDTHKIQKVPVQKTVVSSVIALDIGARRKKILEIVKSKGQATIHEFIQSIQGCSSKTIQRELTSLVLSGTLKKTGERRWSKYSLR